MTSQVFRGNIISSLVPISVASLLLSLGISKPAFSSYFAFSRDYRNGLEKIKLAGKFQATDLDQDGEISITEVKNFEGVVLSQNKKQPELLSVIDFIKDKEEVEFEQFKYNLATNNLEFVIRTLDRKNDHFINSIDPYWQVNFQKEFDSFVAQDRDLIALDYQGTGITVNPDDSSSELDGLAVLLILILSLLRISQQIKADTQTDNNQELDVSVYQQKWR
jgi:hypothetical protein